jgi:hypothetical protein
MAPIVASDLMTPNGPVEMFFFPGEHSNAVEARLSAWITSTYADPRLAPFASDEDRLNRLATAGALARVYESVYMRMNNSPLTLNVTEKGGHGYSMEQIRNVKNLWLQYKGEFEGLLIVDAGKSPAPMVPKTCSVPMRTVW